MIVQLSADLRVMCNGPNFALEYREVSKKGKEYWRTAGHYSNLSDAAISALRLSACIGDVSKDVAFLVHELRVTSQKIAEACIACPDELKRRVLPVDVPKLHALLDRAAKQHKVV